jgi:hypothetical protein
MALVILKAMDNLTPIVIGLVLRDFHDLNTWV